MYFDIHSHIIPCVDDGATDIENSVCLLEMAKENGISTVLATPHFYPSEDSLDDFLSRRKEQFENLKEAIKKLSLPKIYLGCEILYFIGIGTADCLSVLSLNNSKYILIELSGVDINKYLFSDLQRLKKRGYSPVIAHFERYIKEKGFRKLFKFVKANHIAVQINTITLTTPRYVRFLKKIIDNNIFSVLSTDTHSVDARPPFLKGAFDIVREKIGNKYHDILIKNSQKLYDEIIGEDIGE